eukprot:15443898-Alexandrium_andersonii.AAC.1
MAPASPGHRDSSPPQTGADGELRRQGRQRDRAPLVLDRGSRHHPWTVGRGLWPPVQRHPAAC